MKNYKHALPLTLLMLSPYAHAEATWGDLPLLLVKVIGLLIYVRAWELFYAMLAVSALLSLGYILLVMLRMDALSGVRESIKALMLFLLTVMAGCLLVMMIGFGVGLKPVTVNDIIKDWHVDMPRLPWIYKSRAEIKAENDAIPKVKDDLSWQKYSPLKRPWPEYEGALYAWDDPILPAPFSIEIFLGGPRKSKLIKICELDHRGPCDGQVAYMLNRTEYVFPKLVEGNYALHILNLQTGQAIESKPFRLDDKFAPRKHFDITNVQIGDDQYYHEIPLDQF